MPRFPVDERRAALIVIPTIAKPGVLIPAFSRLLNHLDGLPVHVCVSINAVNQADGDTSQAEVVKIWQSYAQEGMLPAESMLTVYRHPGPCGFGGALNRGILAAADGFTVKVGIIKPNEPIVSPVMGAQWPDDMIQSVCTGGLIRYDDGGGVSFEGVDKERGPGLPPLTIFYNDDLEATEGWLAELVAASSPTLDRICDISEPMKPDGSRNPRPMSLYGKVGLVGPVTNLAAGMQCLSGEEVRAWKRLGSDRFAAQWRARNAGTVMTADFLSGFCMGITRDCLEALWGANPDRDGPYLFDEANYPIAGFEDNDLCVRVAEAGYRAAIAIGTFVGHIGHQSFDSAFPDMQRGMKNRRSYYRKWSPWVQANKGRLIAALRVKIEVPHDLRLLRPTLQRLGELVDGVAILFTNNPGEALTHVEGQFESKTGQIPDADLNLLRALNKPNLSGKARGDLLQKWVKSCVLDGARAQRRPDPIVGVGLWPTDRPMNERDERNATISMAESMGAGWIWSIDHDEMVEPRITRTHLERWTSHPDPLVSCLDQGFYTTWDTTRMYRIDRPWGDNGTMTGGMRGWRLWRVNRKAPGRIMAGTDNGLHCGNSPTSDPMAKRHAAIRIHHHGYIREEDRERKRARYQRQDPNPDPTLVGGTTYNHLTYEERVLFSRFMPRCGIGFHMLVHAGEDPNGVMAQLDQMHCMSDAAVLVWTSPPDAPERAVFAEIADLFGACMVDHYIDPNKGGLGDARNAGLDALHRIEDTAHRGMGWSLFLDPDEQLPDSAMISIRRLADVTDCWGWLFRYVNPHQSSDPTHSESVRMARLVPEMRFDGRVHEGFNASILALKEGGHTDILRTAPFTCVNMGLAIPDEKIQAKYDRYFRWALGAIQDGVGRPVDWTTLGLYFANEGLWEAPQRCHAHAVGLDQHSFLAARELATHYLRMARGPAALSASRLPDGHPQRERMDQIVAFCDEQAPAIAGMGMVGKPGRSGWSEQEAAQVIDFLEALARGTVQVPEPEPDAQAQIVFADPKYDRVQEDDGAPE